MGESRRVALLARPGEACERLRAALREAGGEIVIEADPSTLDPQSLRVAAVETVLVALDPAVEDALEKFDEVLGDRAIEVIFDEADLAARREGWDAARWVRHLAAKLHRHDDVLPPGREPEDDEDIDLDAIHVANEADVAYAEEDNAFEMVEEIEMPPVAELGMPSLEAIESIELPSLESIAMPSLEVAELPAFDAIEVEDVPLEAVSFDVEAASFELPSFEPAVMPAQAGIHAVEPAANAEPASAFGALSFTDDLNALDFEPSDAPAFTAPAPQFGQDAQDFDALLRDLGAAEIEEVETVDVAPMEMPAVREFAPKEVLPSLDFDIAMPAAPSPKEAERAMPSFASLSLEALTDEPAKAASATLRSEEAPVAANFHRDLSKLEEKISSLSLMSDTAHEARGAVVILAGIGGPDAVRQILTALPENFTRPVLIQQRLDGGRYDRLVQQMARAASMQVLLAEAAHVIQPGKVYIVPPEIGVAVNAGAAGLRFEDGGSLLDALPSDDSAVLLLSGADPAMVDAAMTHAQGGAFVAGQSPEGCYDAAAPIALAERGGIAGTPNELVQSLLQRWPA